MSDRVARIERALAGTEVELARLRVYIATPGADLEAAYALEASYKASLRRQKASLAAARLQAKMLSEPFVDPLQTDIERQVEAESAAHGPDLGGSRRRGR